MLTDDTGTPGDGKWEINTSLQSGHSGDTTTFKLPLLDVNYGVGERLQLKFEIPWELQRVKGHGNESGTGNSIAGAKWRFFDAGEEGWKISTYPQVQSRFPVAGSTLADSGVSYLLPLEVEHQFGRWGINLDLGRWFRPAAQGDTWIGGIAIGCEVGEGLEFVGELHNEADVHSGRDELTLNFGTRWEMSERFTLLLSAGTDLHNSLEPKSTLLTFLGVQTNL